MTKVHVLAVFASLMSICATTVAQVHYELVARGGMPTPSGGLLEGPAGIDSRINRQGHVFFVADDVVAPGERVQRLFYYDGSGLQVLISAGDEASPGGVAIDRISYIYQLTDDGSCIYKALLSDGNAGFYRIYPGNPSASEYFQGGISIVADFSRTGDYATIADNPRRLLASIGGTVRESFIVGSSPAPGIGDGAIITGVDSYRLLGSGPDAEVLVRGSFSFPPGSGIPSGSAHWIIGGSGPAKFVMRTGSAVPEVPGASWPNAFTSNVVSHAGKFHAEVELQSDPTQYALAVWDGSQLRVNRIASDFTGVPDSAFPGGFRRSSLGGSAVAKTGIGNLTSFFGIWNYWRIDEQPTLLAGADFAGNTLPINDGADSITRADYVQTNSSGDIAINNGWLESGPQGILYYVKSTGTWHSIGSVGETITIDRGPSVGEQLDLGTDPFSSQQFGPDTFNPLTDQGKLLTYGQGRVPGDPGLVNYIMILDLRSLPGYAIPADLDSDGRVDIEDLYHIHQNPEDINGDGVADAEDRRALERYLRRYEPEDMTNGRR